MPSTMAIPSARPTTPTTSFSPFSSSSSPLKARYVSPQTAALNHKRRVSGTRRMSASTTIPLFPNAESPRTLCPRDPVAFAYDPAHLKEWEMPQDMWEKLPPTFQQTVASVQHAGAAVLTGLVRLEEANRATIDEEEEEGEKKTHKDDEDDGHSTDSSITEYRLSADAPAPSDVSKNTRPARNDSGFFARSPMSTATTPSLTSSQPSPDVSPLQLPITPVSSNSFTPPASPAASYYLAELTHLRSEALPRLRHNALRVEAEFQELRRLVGQLQKQGEEVRDADCLERFEAWWKEKKTFVAELEKKVKEQAKGKPTFGSWALSPSRP